MDAGQDIGKKDSVSITELKRLLHELHDHRQDICIRPRLLGKLWFPNFYRIFLVTENGLVLVNEATKETEIITDFAQIVQFELDMRFQIYQPHNHYSVSVFD